MGKKRAAEEALKEEEEEPVTEKKKKKKKVVEEEEPEEPVTEKKKKKKKEVEEEVEEPVTEKKKKKKEKKEVEEEVEEPVTEKKKKKKKEAEEEEAPVAKSPKKKINLAAEAEGPFEVAVKNLSWSVDEEGVQKHFAEAGAIASCRLLKDSEGWSRGMAFIAFETKAGMDAALAWNETDLEGRNIRVEAAQNRTGQPSKGKGKGKGGPGEKPEGCLAVMVMQLSDAVEEDDLWEIFEGCGTVSKVKLLYDRDTGKSRGMGFVDFEETEATDKAVKMTDQEVKGKAIFVKYNVPREEKGSKGKDGKGKGKGKSGPGEKPEGCVAVMVMQLSDAVEEDDLWEIFEDCGTVSKVKLLYDRDTGKSRGMAFVDFEETEATDKAVKMTDKEVKGKAIYVKYNVPREPKGKGKGWGW